MGISFKAKKLITHQVIRYGIDNWACGRH